MAFRQHMNIRRNTEEYLAFTLAEWLQLQHPNLMYHFDFGSGVKLPMGLAVKNKKLNRRAYPDLFIAKPMNGKAGLFLELKREGIVIFKKNGDMVASPHIREQARVLRDLRKEGYVAEFAIGLQQSIDLINKYLDLPKNSTKLF